MPGKALQSLQDSVDLRPRSREPHLEVPVSMLPPVGHSLPDFQSQAGGSEPALPAAIWPGPCGSAGWGPAPLGMPEL